MANPFPWQFARTIGNPPSNTQDFQTLKISKCLPDSRQDTGPSNLSMVLFAIRLADKP